MSDDAGAAAAAAVDATTQYQGVLGAINWVTDTFAPWLALALVLILAAGYYWEYLNQKQMKDEMEKGQGGGERESNRKRKKVSARTVLQNYSEEERLTKMASERAAPRTQRYL